MEQHMSKSIQTWLDEYGESHQNKTNKLIHWVCVPLIFWTVTAFIYAIPTPQSFAEVSTHLNWASISILLTVLFYLRLSLSLTVGMTVFTVLCYTTVVAFDAVFTGYLVISSAVAFVILWALQFYGHEVEGKKPSFFKDVQYLMIGPAWLMSFIYQKMGLKY
jgi:uncharacterized membrane protein YGL010W